MGLDITAYKKLKEVKNPKWDEYGEELLNWKTEVYFGASMDWSEKNFKGRGEGVDSKKVYSWEEKYGFSAGSYSGYNWWRDTLNIFSNTLNNAGKPFYELIEFADNEGVIGNVVSQKLYKDFVDNENKAIEFSKSINDGEHWLNKYYQWKMAFEYAKENGAVEFH